MGLRHQRPPRRMSSWLVISFPRNPCVNGGGATLTGEGTMGSDAQRRSTGNSTSICDPRSKLQVWCFLVFAFWECQGFRFCLGRQNQEVKFC